MTIPALRDFILKRELVVAIILDSESVLMFVERGPKSQRDHDGMGRILGYEQEGD